MTVPHQDLRLVVDGVSHDLSGREVDEHGCRVYAESDGTTWGSPESLTAVLTSMMRNGDLISGLGYGNREQTIGLVIEGPNLGAVARAEERLQCAMGRTGELVWKPGDWAAQPNVFDVVWSQMSHTFDPLEAVKGFRRFTVTLQALPFARSLSQYVTTLTTGGGAPPVTVNDATSLAGWSIVRTSGPTATLSLTGEPAVRANNFDGKGGSTLRLATSSLTLAPGDYIEVDFYGQVPRSVGVGTQGLPLHTRTSKSGYRYMVTYGPVLVPTTVSEITLGRPESSGPGLAWREPWWKAWDSLDLVEVHGVRKLSDPSVGRQAALSFTAGGSAPTYGSLELHSDDPLGDVLIYTGPQEVSGFSPAMSAYISDVTTAPESADPTSPTGRKWALVQSGGNRRWGAAFPASELNHGSGSAVLWVRLTSDATGRERIYWSSDTRMDGATVASANGERFIDFETGVEQFVPLAEIPFPVGKVGPEGVARVHIAQESTGSSGVVSVTEGYVCRTGEGYATTMVKAGSRTRVFIDAPSADDPFGAVWVGDAEDRSDVFSAGPLLRSADVHTFEPTGTRVWVTTGAVDVTLTERHHMRYHDHVTALPPLDTIPEPLT